MTAQVLTLVRVPITEVENWVRTKHVLPKVLTDFRIEENTLVLYFSEEEPFPRELDTQLPRSPTRKRRARRKRNRMKTRGWEKLANFVNSKGQRCTIYKPFVDALRDSKFSVEEQKRLVEKILKANRNKPSDISVQYFLENTLEYLQKQAPQTQPLS